jgi:hypothetical protein
MLISPVFRSLAMGLFGRSGVVFFPIDVVSSMRADFSRCFVGIRNSGAL